jgi:hypothetical protein
MAAQRRRRRDAEDEVEAVLAAEVDGFRRAVMTVGAQQDFRLRPMGADGAQQTTQKAFGLLSLPLGRFAGRSMAATKRPEPSKTTIG